MIQSINPRYPNAMSSRAPGARWVHPVRLQTHPVEGDELTMCRKKERKKGPYLATHGTNNRDWKHIIFPIKHVCNFQVVKLKLGPAWRTSRKCGITPPHLNPTRIRVHLQAGWSHCLTEKNCLRAKQLDRAAAKHSTG